MRRRAVSTFAATWALSGVLLAGCGGGEPGEDEKAAACASWDRYEDALDDSNQTLGKPQSEQVEIFEAEFRAYDEVKQAFTKAAAADESWSDVQEAAYAVSSDENASRRKIDAACDRLRS